MFFFVAVELPGGGYCTRDSACINPWRSGERSTLSRVRPRHDFHQTQWGFWSSHRPWEVRQLLPGKQHCNRCYPSPANLPVGPWHLPRGRATASSSPLWGRGNPKRCHPARETSACSVLSQGVSFAPRWEKCPLRATGPQCCQKLGWGGGSGGAASGYAAGGERGGPRPRRSLPFLNTSLSPARVASAPAFVFITGFKT